MIIPKPPGISEWNLHERHPLLPTVTLVILHDVMISFKGVQKELVKLFYPKSLHLQEFYYYGISDSF